MAFKLIESAQARWRTVNAPHLVALVRAGAAFHKGKLLERPTDITVDTSNPEPQIAGSEVARNSLIHSSWQYLAFTSGASGADGARGLA